MPAPGRSYARLGAFLDGGGAAAFDAGALRFSRGEAAALDPHARLLLEQTQVRVSEHHPGFFAVVASLQRLSVKRSASQMDQVTESRHEWCKWAMNERGLGGCGACCQKVLRLG